MMTKHIGLSMAGACPRRDLCFAYRNYYQEPAVCAKHSTSLLQTILLKLANIYYCIGYFSY